MCPKICPIFQPVGKARLCKELVLARIEAEKNKKQIVNQLNVFLRRFSQHGISFPIADFLALDVEISRIYELSQNVRLILPPAM